MSRYQGSHTNRSRERVSVRGPRIQYADEIEDERQYESNWQQRHPHELDRRQIPPRMTRATTFRPEVSKDELDEHELNRLAKITYRPRSRSPSLVFNNSINVLNKTKSPPPDYTDSDSDDGESLADYRSEGYIRRSSARTSLPSRSSGSSNKLRQKGPHSLSGICNKDTISKDNTVGHGALMDDLLASFGRKAMGIKDEHQYGQAIPRRTITISPPPRSSPPSHSYVSYSEDEDEIFEAGQHRYVQPRTHSRREYANKASAAMRYIQSSKRGHKERKRTPQYALDKKNGVPLDIPDEDSEGYESDIIKVEYYETD
ncbi:hypothetical protein FGSG_13517 [Fusarium graminearum PH-1]|uniref:Chromosome 4, complete genome n=1 Tax=Gibberella zeae (strain ATCC MYA-4620 / CBS 123657 / FGSC 9075 / NRRL 31084 / PH-1) TaxID=229533 RepID=I1S9I6_GIBZE|nr:hypothetical protein FGSG_13517 [Fusarium graminearum PH-1]ESU15641.1 hypothetical protein FGSG_13517 [Fusarium graminearum PH-1]CAF3623021.1 unnamed protein product [Fusarium graminearum]CEF85667.1 unnamed protein product [Fusarium graminearum]|eukprot:XP_011328675.1 hypothetical protein FGSG_13517 [Fusarium graminearum PH-1]